uniref:G_PROTEIN_RECEP_F1_2 domain-containing protein n=1 Tax=Steinernema glaseri TaxID=37863 RepID=A0A1I7Y1F3_9BILA
MTDPLSSLFNTLMNATSVGSIIVKTIAMYLIIFHTPKNMRHFSNFILNELLWNLSANLLYTIAHPIPMLPMQCFRLDGLLGDLFPHESVGHMMFLCTMLSGLNCLVGLMLCFQFRYISLTRKQRLKNVRTVWGYVYCAVVHFCVSCLFIYCYVSWTVPLSEYPNKAVRVPRMFCFHPSGFHKSFALFCYFGSILVTLVAMIICYVLCLRQLRIDRGLLDAKTMKMQKTLLRNVMILTVVPALIGFLPLLVAAFFLYMNEMAYAREICVVCILVVMNHGTVYGIVTIMLFKAYRNAFRRLLICVAKKMPFRNDSQMASSARVWSVPVHMV